MAEMAEMAEWQIWQIWQRWQIWQNGRDGREPHLVYVGVWVLMLVFVLVCVGGKVFVIWREKKRKRKRKKKKKIILISTPHPPPSERLFFCHSAILPFCHSAILPFVILFSLSWNYYFEARKFSVKQKMNSPAFFFPLLFYFYRFFWVWQKWQNDR